MVCVYCGYRSQIYNSRRKRSNNLVWRRRRCLHCSAVFTTTEAPNLSSSWLVQAHTGALVPFSADKLYLSLYESLKHRTGAVSDARHLTNTIISKLYQLNNHGVIDQTMLIQIATVAMNRFDQVASTHYQAFHRYNNQA